VKAKDELSLAMGKCLSNHSDFKQLNGKSQGFSLDGENL